MRRRNFLANSLLAAGLTYTGEGISRAGAALPQGTETTDEKAHLQSAHLSLEYNLSRGQASVYRAQGKPLILNATAAAVFPRGMALASDGNYARRGRTAPSKTAELEGDELIVTCTDSTGKLDMQSHIALLRNEPGTIFEVVLTNVSAQEILVRHAKPLRALLGENAGCLFSPRKILTNGYMHHAPGLLLDVSHEFVSSWNAAFYDPGSQSTLVLGFLDNLQGEGQVAVS